MVRKAGSLQTRLFLVFFLSLAILPLIYDSRSLYILCTQIFIFAIFAMSYDLLLGYTGIVSFGHGMFFGIGAYSVAIFMKNFGATTGNFLFGILVAVVIAAIISYAIGMLSLRLKSHFYAMLTLAVSQLLFVVAEKWRSLTAGGDGFTFSVPDFIRDRFSFYYVCLLAMIVLFFVLRHFVQSPLGKVLKAIGQNEQRAEALGYQIINYKVIVSVVAGVIAAISGGLYAGMLRFVNTTVFSIEITLDALLMTMIGGIGTLFGSILGSGVVEIAHDGLTSLAKVHPIFERWIIFMGLLYIVVVLIFPSGITGSFNNWLEQRKKVRMQQKEIQMEEAGKKAG
ncbi:branched-chain amino acid ABC transporter permease [Brevibacillus daliensis]|uniref:branched-chain amino acid ABC transporter permease n=1 Tax=Brevibacillus daliensis TaxID=2892995 RepID=UPI001E3E4401|nr:branched-chain amino acid ABC transporter permease [Brevibacillus daliensis]